jgi:hypothetical protein
VNAEVAAWTPEVLSELPEQSTENP